jgi:hypothetical protein
MNRVLKTFLLWLLIAVLPVQGFAAALRYGCDPEQAAAARQMDPMAGMAHEAMMMSHGEGHGGEWMAAAPATLDQKSSHGHKSLSCNAGAVCCLGAAAPPAVPMPAPAFTSAESCYGDPAAIVTGFIPDSLDRPPRHLSA